MEGLIDWTFTKSVNESAESIKESLSTSIFAEDVELTCVFLVDGDFSGSCCMEQETSRIASMNRFNNFMLQSSKKNSIAPNYLNIWRKFAATKNQKSYAEIITEGYWYASVSDS